MVCSIRSPGKSVKTRQARLSDLLASPACFLGLGLGSGLSPKAPGTAGTIVAVPLFLVCADAGTTVLWVVTVAMILMGAWICQCSATQLDSHDHPAIVWDEFAGFFVTMLFVSPTLHNVIAGFVLFRLFDILKPWPIKMIDEKVHGGIGIMLDDLIAGVLAGGILFLLNQWIS